MESPGLGNDAASVEGLIAELGRVRRTRDVYWSHLVAFTEYCDDAHPRGEGVVPDPGDFLELRSPSDAVKVDACCAITRLIAITKKGFVREKNINNSFPALDALNCSKARVGTS